VSLRTHTAEKIDLPSRHVELSFSLAYGIAFQKLQVASSQCQAKLAKSLASRHLRMRRVIFQVMHFASC